MNDLRILRDRQQSASEAMDVDQGDEPLYGSAAVLAKTTTVETYPTTASAFYACLPQDIDGAEIEGAAASYVPQSNAVFYGWNAGTAVPPPGTPVVCHAVGGRWVFRYDSSS
jgi:hypothetical protein